MDDRVMTLMADSGKLETITALIATGGRISALALSFASGTLRLRCDDDTDEIIGEVAEPQLSYVTVSDPLLLDLVGMTVSYAWELTNHRGYTDAFQIRFTDSLRREATRQFEVGASAIDVLQVTT